MTVIERAYAKINLFLDVVERREDGFHNIVSVMQSVGLFDTLTINAEICDESTTTLTCDDSSLPVDENNLVFKAASKYISRHGLNARVHIDIQKKIPIGAGLGGGSSDAAATLRGLNRIFCLSNDGELAQMATELGSDVPFCLMGGRALCTGRGEKMQHIADYTPSHVVIAIGNERISTPLAYRALDQRYNNFVDRGHDPIAYEGQIYNIFENVTNISEVHKIKEIMIKFGAESALMSGSGPSVFGLFNTKNDADRAIDELIKNGFSAYYCKTL